MGLFSWIERKKIEQKLYQDGLFLQFVINPTSEMCKIAISQNGMALKFIPEEHKDFNLCRNAVCQNPFALKYISDFDGFDLYALCDCAVRKNGLALEFVPENTKYYNDICNIAYYNNHESIIYAKGNVDIDVSIEFFENNYENMDENHLKQYFIHSNLFLSKIDNNKRTHNICRIAVCVDGENLEFVPEEYKTLGICYNAIKNSVKAMDFIPKLYFPEFYKYIIRNNIDVCIPDEFSTIEKIDLYNKEAKYIELVSEDGMKLKNIPIEFMTYNVCHAAIQQNPKSLKFAISLFDKERYNLEKLERANSHSKRKVSGSSLKFS